MLTRKLNIQKILSKASKEIERPEAELILAHTLKKTREFIIAHPELHVSFFDHIRFVRSLRKRKKGMPLAYITGHKAFFGYDFAVNRHTLVPRPDTEILVESVLEYTKKLLKTKSVTVIDIGTGSGCIPISIANELRRLRNEQKKDPSDTSPDFRYPTLIFFAGDSSRNALRIAKQNAQKYNAQIDFRKGNLFEPFAQLLAEQSLDTQTKLIITANLPYLDESWYREEPSIHHEPTSALVARDMGTELYKLLFNQLHNARLKAQVFIEIDPRQTDMLRTHISQTYPEVSIEVLKDLSGHDRVMSIAF